MNELFIEYGYWGMGIAAFLAGTFVPFSSEAVMAALLATTTMDPVMVVVSATIGNVFGSMVNYAIGCFGTKEMIAHWFRISQEKIDKAQQYVMLYGALMGFITFIPLLGTAIAIALGILRANPWLTFLTTFLGKSIRYIIIAYTVGALA